MADMLEEGVPALEPNRPPSLPRSLLVDAWAKRDLGLTLLSKNH